MGIALRGKRLDSKGGDGNRRYVPGLCGPISHSSHSERYFCAIQVPSKSSRSSCMPWHSSSDPKDWVLGVKWAGCLARLGRLSQSRPGPGVGDSWRMPSCAEQMGEEPGVLWTHSPIIRLCSLEVTHRCLPTLLPSSWLSHFRETQLVEAKLQASAHYA